MVGSEPSISHRIVKSVAWVVGSGVATKAIDFITLLVLARVLTPSDFGLVAIAMSVVVVIDAMLDMPIGGALLRLPELTRADLNTAFTLSIIRGLGLGLVLAGLAFAAARLYGQPRLLPLIAVLALAPIARGLTSPRMIEFAKQMNFQRDFAIEITGKLVAMSLATVIAVKYRTYWAMVLGTVATPITMVVASYALAPFIPRFSLSNWRSFTGFLGWSSASQMVNAINWQCDRLILGRFTLARELGAFTAANDLAVLPERTLIKTIMRPIFAAFTLVRDDPGRLRDAYSKTTAGVMMVGLPVMLALALLAGPAVQCVLGGQWRSAAPLLSWLAYSSIPPLFTAGLAPLVMTLNRTQIFFVRSSWELAIKIPCVAVGAIWFGVYGVVAARILTDLAMALISMSLASELIGMSVLRQVLSCWRVIGAGGVMSVALLLLRPLLAGLEGPGLLLGLVGVGSVAMAVYAACIVCFWLAAGQPSGVEASLEGQISAAARIGFGSPRRVLGS